MWKIRFGGTYFTEYASYGAAPSRQEKTKNGCKRLEERMIRLFLLAITGAVAPVLIVGAIPSVIVLMAAPPAFIYLFAFVALTPMCGAVAWRVLPPLRNSEALGDLVNKVANAGDVVFVGRAVRRTNRAASLPSDWR
jgi:fatty acid desaturase